LRFQGNPIRHPIAGLPFIASVGVFKSRESKKAEQPEEEKTGVEAES
jgi:hypothetical protein